MQRTPAATRGAQGGERRPVNRRQTRRQAVGGALGIWLAGRSAGRSRAASGLAAPRTIQAAPDYARPDILVEPESLPRLRPAVGRALRTEDDVQLVALAAVDEHAAGRIPDAAQIDWPALEVIDTSDASLSRWRAGVEQLLPALGVTPETRVVAYDAGTLFAARLWWVLSYLGHSRVSVLHGGLAGWDAAGGEIVSGPLDAADTGLADDEPYQSEPRAEILAQASMVLASLGNPAVAIVDARTPGEYAAGHVPGAVNLNYPRNAAAEPPHRWLPAEELLAMYEAIGVTPDKLVIPYCSSGVRSAVTFFTLHLLGYPKLALYTGSWQEWGGLPGAPVATGDQP